MSGADLDEGVEFCDKKVACDAVPGLAVVQQEGVTVIEVSPVVHVAVVRHWLQVCNELHFVEPVLQVSAARELVDDALYGGGGEGRGEGRGGGVKSDWEENSCIYMHTHASPTHTWTRYVRYPRRYS